MSRVFQKPENALKRAEGISHLLTSPPWTFSTEVIMSKRSRATAINVLEPIVLRFIELCVLLSKGKLAKEGLHQYKNISQNVTVTAIELVIKKFIDLSEAKVAEAQEKADQINLDNVDDLEALETPESIILSTVSGDTMASQAFKFCEKYTRKTEFRRLCEILRQHLTTSAKYAHQTHSINLSDPETLQRHLDTRFEQLGVAAKLELWQEGFRSIEDIHTLFIVSKKPPKPLMQANYYEKLAEVFMVGENYLFHAAAYSKLFAIYRNNKNLPDEEHERMATIVLISALSIPIIAASKTSTTTADSEDTNKPRDQRLTNLLRINKTPTRESLLKEALNKNVFSRVRPELRELYNILEVDFHPLSICKKIAPIITKLSAQKDLTAYARPLHQVILTRLLQQLSQVYQSITIDSIVKLASFPSLDSENVKYDEGCIEKFIMNGCRKGELSMRVNHMAKTITFETDLFGAGKGGVVSKPQQAAGGRSALTPSDQIRAHLTSLAARLNVAVNLINPQKLQEKRDAQQEAIRVALENMEEERRLAAERVILIEKRREIKEYEAAKKVRDDEIKRQEKERREAELEKTRIEEEMRKREIEKIAKIREDREKKEALELKERIAKDGKNKLLIAELDGLDADALLAKQRELLEIEKQALATKMRQISKRAFRKAETVKWEADHVEQKKIDKAYYNALKTAQLEASKGKHVEDLKIKQRVTRMLPDYEDFKSKLDVARETAHQAEVSRVEAMIADAKAKRIAEVKRRKQDELARKNKEDEARRIFLENEKIRLAESARLAEEKAARDAARKAEEAERNQKLDEMARRQQEREREAEERLKQREREREQEKTRSTADRGGDAWARRADADVWRRPAAPAAPSSGGKYVPPSRRNEEPSGSAAPISSSGKYVPPSRREGGGGGDSRFGGQSDRPAAFGNRDRDERSSGFGNRDRDERPRDDRFAAFGGRGGDRDQQRPSGFGAAPPSRRDGENEAPRETGGWRGREAACCNVSSSGKYVPPSRRGNQ
ncbi:hypothetical protein BDR26DRAFT_865085 [Obelidium mucronatum]|nr:hypothetical protein BDR26DRAFT_865085 [Obelidium mucronatum]